MADVFIDNIIITGCAMTIDGQYVKFNWQLMEIEDLSELAYDDDMSYETDFLSHVRKTLRRRKEL